MGCVSNEGGEINSLNALTLTYDSHTCRMHRDQILIRSGNCTPLLLVLGLRAFAFRMEITLVDDFEKLPLGESILHLIALI